MPKACFFTLLTLFAFLLSSAAQTVTLTCTGSPGSCHSGSVTGKGNKTDGDMSIVYDESRGWATFDLSSIPAGARINSVMLEFTVNSTRISGVNNFIYGFTGDPRSTDGITLFANCAGGRPLNDSEWGLQLNQRKLNATGLAFIKANIGGNCNLGFWRGNGAVNFTINGYPSDNPPRLIINYTPDKGAGNEAHYRDNRQPAIRQIVNFKRGMPLIFYSMK